MSEKNAAQFAEIRKLLANGLRAIQEHGEHGKQYEGTWELWEQYPSIHDDPTGEKDPEYVGIALHCYLIGPSRHYKWTGKTWDEVMVSCRNSVDAWIAQDVDEWIAEQDQYG